MRTSGNSEGSGWAGQPARGKAESRASTPRSGGGRWPVERFRAHTKAASARGRSDPWPVEIIREGTATPARPVMLHSTAARDSSVLSAPGARKAFQPAPPIRRSAPTPTSRPFDPKARHPTVPSHKQAIPPAGIEGNSRAGTPRRVSSTRRTSAPRRRGEALVPRLADSFDRARDRPGSRSQADACSRCPRLDRPE